MTIVQNGSDLPRKIVPTAGKKRGRIIRTDAGKEISHEELVCGLIKRTAVELANAGQCACGATIEKPKKGPMPARCGLCDAEQRRAYQRNKQRARGANERGRYNKTTAKTLAHISKRKASHRAAVKRRYDERKAVGLCTRCGKTPATSRCEECKKKKENTNG